MENLNLKDSEVLVLRKCREDFTSRNGFIYPEKGYVGAHDWINNGKCGNGLHGLEWGIGYYDINDHGKMWQIIKVDKNNRCKDLLLGIVKFKCGEVILSTLDQKEAMDLLMKHAPDELKGEVNYQVVFSGDNSVVTCGNYSTIISGNNSIITSGYGSTITSWYCSYITSGNYSTITSGFESTITSGDDSTITSGDESIIISRNYSTVIIRGNNVTFILGKKSRVITESSIFIEGIDFKADEKVIVKYGKIIKENK
ncbi:MAG: hypothetical protein E6R13_05630 [Spirochaetes bacterium]|nr:MAG: hypothetical protein E6R13_05630 [Spirochaetota bacterium]